MDFLLSRRQLNGLIAHIKTKISSKIALTAKYRKLILVSLIALLGLTVSTVSYKYYVNYKRAAALELFSECAELYKKALSDEKVDQWVEVEAAAKAGYQQAGQTGLTPYFLMYQAQALKHQNKLSEVQALVKQAFDSLSSSSPVYALYAVAYAITLVDSNQTAQALELLKKLADDSKTKQRDLVLFYLGEIYNREGQTDLAKATFELLVKEFKIAEQVEYGFNQESGWVRPAMERLSYL